MLLVIDVSNTNMVLGVFNGENLVANWRLSTKSGRTADETGLLICSLFAYSDVSVGDIEAIIVSSACAGCVYSTLNGIKKFLKKRPDCGACRSENRYQPADGKPEGNGDRPYCQPCGGV